MTVQINKVIGLAGILMLILLASSDRAWATGFIDISNAAFANVSDRQTSIPVGHAEFCRTRPAECTINARFVAAEELTNAKWQQLLAVNSFYNTSIKPMTDEDLYQVKEFWTYPSAYGDCEDYVLAKRRALIEAGWAASTLMIAVVRQENGEGHAVLMARTDRGDLILDNQEGMIKLWNDTPYRYVKRQSQYDAGQWVDIYDDRTTILASR